MYFFVKSMKSPFTKFLKYYCVSQKNIYLKKSVIYQVSICNQKYLMSCANNVNKTTPVSLLVQQEKTDLTTIPKQNLSSSSENQPPTEVQKLSNKDKLKRAVKDYGATVIVFHVTISLMSLGISYLVISSGVDVESLLARVGLDTHSNLAAGASTFVVAYAVHKVFAPVRISITLGATPFIVRYLRRIGILKPPKA